MPDIIWHHLSQFINHPDSKQNSEALMKNELLWLGFMVLNFGLILLGYKLFGKKGLFAWIVLSAILANVQVLKTVELFGQVATLGNIIYGTSFLATDILSEKYGKQEARKGVYIGMYTLLVTAVLMTFSLKFAPHESDWVQDSLVNVFGIIPRIAFASMLAYFISQMHDTWAYEFWKSKNKHIWVRNNLSTAVSQLIDTLAFTFIAFWGIYETPIFVSILVTTYVFKFIVAAADTPFIYLAKNINKHIF